MRSVGAHFFTIQSHRRDYLHIFRLLIGNGESYLEHCSCAFITNDLELYDNLLDIISNLTLYIYVLYVYTV